MPFINFVNDFHENYKKSFLVYISWYDEVDELK